MRIYNYSDLSKTQISQLVQRNVDPANEIRAVVEEVIENVKANGDKALFEYAQKFDKVSLVKLYIDKVELETLSAGVLPTQKAALETAYQNIYKFHAAQLK